MAEAVRVKICGLTRREDAAAAASAGADYLGVVVSDGFGRSLPPAEGRRVVVDLPCRPVAVLVDEDAEEAVRRAGTVGAQVVQLHGSEPPEVVAAVRDRGPWQVWKALRVATRADLLRGVSMYAGYADGILVEGRKEGVVGGGGARVDFSVVAEVRPELPEDLFLILAGGLTPENVAEGVARIRPAVVDVSSGVEEAPGRKSPGEIRRFIENARGALSSGRERSYP